MLVRMRGLQVYIAGVGHFQLYKLYMNSLLVSQADGTAIRSTTRHDNSFRRRAGHSKGCTRRRENRIYVSRFACR